MGFYNRKPSKRQVAYREYLKTEHWKWLHAAVKERDKVCVKCGSGEHLQAHHKFYRGRFEDSIPEDLILLCRGCHQAEHGFGISEIQKICRRLETAMNQEKPLGPEDWGKLKGLLMPWDNEYGAACDWELEQFANVIFRYVGFVLPTRLYGHVSWWMDERGEVWRRKQFRVRALILSRSPTWEHLHPDSEYQKSFRKEMEENVRQAV